MQVSHDQRAEKRIKNELTGKRSQPRSGTLADVARSHLAAHRLMSARSMAELRLREDPADTAAMAVLDEVNRRIADAGGAPKQTVEPAPAIAASAVKPVAPEPRATMKEAKRLQADGAEAQAEELCRALLDRQPDNVEALTFLGGVLQKRGETAEAVAWFRRAHSADPDHPSTGYNLGVALQKLDDAAGAFEAYGRALVNKPDWPELWFNLGTLAQKTRREAEAIRYYRQALAFRPDYATALNNLANMMRDQGDMEESIALFGRCLAVEPDHQTARFNRGLTRLLSGDYKGGFADYATRYMSDHIKRLGGFRGRELPVWQGEPLEGKTILVQAEQGAGDTIQFCRFLPELRARGARVVLESQRMVMSLMERAGLADELIERKPDRIEVEADYQIYLMDLPGVLGVTPETVPADLPYLKADPALIPVWRQRLSGDGRPAIGILWQGNPKNKANPWRSVPFELLTPVLDRTEIRFVSLQKGPEPHPDHPNLINWTDDLKTYDDTAALICCLDLVIGICTSVTHLSGALGAPTWVLLHRTPDWRWGLEGETSPWYPTHRLFRQKTRGDWLPVVDDLQKALTGWLAALGG